MSNTEGLKDLDLFSNFRKVKACVGQRAYWFKEKETY
jgi:hypothetical protein